MNTRSMINGPSPLKFNKVYPQERDILYKIKEFVEKRASNIKIDSVIPFWDFDTQHDHVIGLKLRMLNLLEVPDLLRPLRHLKTFHIFGNRLEKLPDWIFDLEHLGWLNLSRNEISRIPEGICRLEKLNWLTLSSNPLTSLPKDLSRLKSLQKLFMWNCGLKKVPRGLKTVQSLYLLSLSENQITDVGGGWSSLRSLTHLELDSNRISHLPSSMGDLPSLRELNLKSNPIENLPLELGQIGSLERIIVDPSRPSAFSTKFKGFGTSVVRYLRRLNEWSPREVVEKIRKNQPLSDLDLENHLLGKYLTLILRKIQGCDNQVKEHFLNHVRKRFSISLQQSEHHILL